MNKFTPLPLRSGRSGRDLVRMLVLLALLGWALAGCKTIGQAFPYASVPRIVVGETTMQQVQELFGPPYRTGNEDGLPTWTYVDSYVSLFGWARARDLYIKFDASNRVRSCQYNSTEPGDGRGT